MKPSFPLGVDILEWKKAGEFYRRHHDRLADWLTTDEKKFVAARQKPYEGFAMIFAAKEAASKALGIRAAGPEMLRSIRLKPRSSRSFSILKHSSLEVTVSRHRRHVVACCLPVRQAGRPAKAA